MRPFSRSGSSRRASGFSSASVARTAARRWAAAVAALAAAATLSSAAPAPPSGGEGTDGLRVTQIQAMATHNSYHREVTFAEQQLMAEHDPRFRTLLYSHASLPVQFSRQQARGIELDVFPDPDGGLYARPLIREAAGLPPLAGRELHRPGFKVLHWADFDYRSNCLSLKRCLRQVRDWSQRRPGHAPVPVLLELKETDPEMEARGGAESPPWDTEMLDALDAEIRSVFPDEETVTPDDVRRPGLTLGESVRKHGWPTLRAARGKVMFLMDNDDQKLQDAYRAGGRESLQGRVLFTDSEPGRADAAFMKVNDPTGLGKAAIRKLVKQGYFVRTRSDVPLEQAESGDTGMLRDALSSGAQMVSTDFPVPGLAARYNSDYVAELPHGSGPVRCNPVTAPGSQCPRERIER